MSKPILRLYGMEDEALTVAANTMHGNATDDLALFTAKFPFFVAGFLTSFMNAITLALGVLTDGSIVMDIKVLTENVNLAMKDGYDLLRNLDIYAKLAFPNTPGQQRAFGQDTWLQAKNDSEKMVIALTNAHEKANKAPYKAALIAKGFLQTDIDNLLTFATAIQTANFIQEALKSDRPVQTEERIIIYNAVYRFMQTINLCSIVVFKDSPAKLDQYKLTSPTSNPATILRLHVEAQGSGLALEGAEISFSNPAMPSTFLTNHEGNVDITLPHDTESADFSVSLANFVDLDISGSTILPGETNPLTIQLTAVATGIVNGNVKQGGINLAGAVVTVDGVSGMSFTTGVDGNYSLLTVPIGMQTIRATLADNSAFLLFPITVVEGGTVVADFNF